MPVASEWSKKRNNQRERKITRQLRNGSTQRSRHAGVETAVSRRSKSGRTCGRRRVPRPAGRRPALPDRPRSAILTYHVIHIYFLAAYRYFTRSPAVPYHLPPVTSADYSARTEKPSANSYLLSGHAHFIYDRHVRRS